MKGSCLTFFNIVILGVNNLLVSKKIIRNFDGLPMRIFLLLILFNDLIIFIFNVDSENLLVFSKFIMRKNLRL